MKYIFFLSAILFACAFSINAQIAKPTLGENASINGKVLQNTEKPLAYTEIELVPVGVDKQVNDPRLLATTNSSGNFAFSNVPDGSYTLSINFDEKPTATSPYPTFFYPDATNRAEAKIFTVGAGSKFDKIIFRLPPKLLQRKITGKIVGSDGKPAANAFVVLRDVEYDDTSFTFDNAADKNGNFTVTGFEMRQYIIGVIQLDKPLTIYTPPGNPTAFGKTELFVLDANNATFVITLKKIAERNDIY